MTDDGIGDEPPPASTRVAVDDLLPAGGWSSSDVAALAKWTQGCLVPGSIFAAASWVPVHERTHALEVRSTDFDPNGWMIVLSQTCDVVGTGPGERQPVVMCSPVIDITNESANKINSIKTWSVTDLAPVDCVPAPGTWAADLRIAVPLHKDALVAVPAVAGYRDEQSALMFSDHVATRFRRPALNDVLSSGLKHILDETIRTAPKTGNDSWYQNVEQVRLEITPSRLRPTWVRIHLLCVTKLTPAQKAQWLTSEKQIKKLFAEHGITYGTMTFDTVAAVKAAAYRQWSPLPIPRLQRPQFW